MCVCVCVCVCACVHACICMKDGEIHNRERVMCVEGRDGENTNVHIYFFCSYLQGDWLAVDESVVGCLYPCYFNHLPGISYQTSNSL